MARHPRAGQVCVCDHLKQSHEKDGDGLQRGACMAHVHGANSHLTPCICSKFTPKGKTTNA